MSIHFDYTVDVQQALDNLGKVERKVKENIDIINTVSQNINYSDNVTKPLQEAQGIVAQLKESMVNTGKISRQELEALQDDLIVASDKLREVEYLNQTILADLNQGLSKARMGRFNSTNGDNARKYSTQISEYQQYIATHKKLVGEAKKLGVELDNIQVEIDKVSSSLNKQEQSTNKVKNSSVSFITQLRNMKQELYQMEIAGDTSSDAYKKLSNEIMKFEATRKGVMAGLNPLSTYKGIISGMSAISGTTTAFAGALSLFEEKSEAVQKITGKLNALMSITIGLQQIEQQLLSSSDFKINIVAKAKQWYNNLLKQETVITRALAIERARETATATAQATATNIQVSATRKGVLANTLFAKSFRMIGLAIKSIPGIGWLLALTGVVIGVVAKINSIVKKQKEEQKKAYEEADKANKDFADKVGEHAGKTIAKYRELQKEYKKLTTQVEKNKWIKNHQKDFNDLGYAINNVIDADKAFIINSDKVVEAIKKRARATALTEKLQELSKEELSLEEQRGNITVPKQYKKVSRTAYSQASRQAVVYWETVEDYDKERKLMDEKRKEIDNQLQKNRKAQEDYGKKIERTEKEIAETEKQTGLKRIERTEKQTNEIEKQKKALEKYNKSIENANKNLRDARNSAIEDDTEKRIAQENARFEDEKKKIEQELKDIQELAKKAGKDLPEDVMQGYNERLEIAEKEHNDKIEKSQKDASDKRQQELDKLLDSYADYNEKRLSIDKKYNKDLEKLQELRKQAEEKGNDDEVKRIDNAIKRNKINKTKEVVELDFQQLKETPEYVRAFEDLENTSTETIRYLIQEFDKVKQAVGESLDPQDLQEYIDVLEKMQTELDRRDTFTAITNARLELKQATEELTQAEKEYEALEKNFGKGSQEEREAIKKVISAKDKQTKASKKLTNAETSLLNSIKDLASGFKDLGDSIGGEFGDAISTIGDMGVTILATVLQLKALEIQAKNTEISIRSLQTATIILAAVSAAFSVITTLSNKFFNKENDSYDRAKKALDGYIEALDRVISKERELMNFYTGEAGEKAYQQAKQTIEKQIDLIQETWDKYLGSGAKSDTFMHLWDKHSHGKQIERDIEKLDKKERNEIIKSIQEALGISYNQAYDLTQHGMKGLLDLNFEQLVNLKKTKLWERLDDESRDYINTLIECGDELRELEREHAEWKTGLSAKDWQNNFLDGLLDIEATAEDVFNNIAEYIRKAMIQHLVFSHMQDELEKFYNEYADYMGEAEGLTTQQRQEWLADYKERLQNLIEQGKLDTEAINELFPDLMDGTRSANNNAFASMTQDQATKLEGMFIALQGHTYDIRDYTHEMRDYAVIIQREISGIHVDTSAIVRMLGGVEDRMVTVDNRLRDFEMRGIRMQ